MDTTFWSFVYIAAAVQAGLLGVVLWRRTVNQQANRLLAVWVMLSGIDLAVKAVYWHLLSPEWFRAYRFVALFPYLYGSLFFLYVRALTRGTRFRGRDVVHLLGFAAMFALNVRVFLMGRTQLQSLSLRWQGGERSIGLWFDLPLFVYSLSYVLAALIEVHRYRQRLRQQRSDADRLSLRWIGLMALCQIVIWSIALLQEVVYLPVINYGLLFGAVAAWIYVVGWLSLNQPAVADEAKPGGNQGEAVDPSAGNGMADDARFPDVEARLGELMSGEAALYREPALTIGEVARRSGYPEYLVSAVINRRLGGSFWDYINRLRIEAVRERLADADDTRTILDIAYDCGFTSKSTFNAAFKRQVGDTPSSYRKAAVARFAPAG